MNKRIFAGRFLFCLLGAWVSLVDVIASHAYAGSPPPIAWTHQLGTSGDDESLGVSADGMGNVYISGSTDGSLSGQNAGGYDAFVSKYDSSGNLAWSRQLGTSGNDCSFGVSADGLGNVYISGSNNGLFSPKTYDAFVSKYDSAGNLAWSRQLGTSRFDSSYGVSADGLGNVYISGSTEGSLGGLAAGLDDAFVSKYDSAGNLAWSRQLGTSSHDWSRSISADGLGNVYIGGSTNGSLGGPSAGDYDAFISKYDSTGDLIWSRQLGTSGVDYIYGVSADRLGSVYISGETNGSLSGPSAGAYDAFVSKYDSSGNLAWTCQLGTSSYDESYGVFADHLGNVYISGATEGSLSGQNAGGYDAFVSKYDSSGNLAWTCQLGTSDNDCSFGVSADGMGNVFISGYTGGSLVGPNAGGTDAFVANIPEPASLSLLVLYGMGFVCRRNSK